MNEKLKQLIEKKERELMDFYTGSHYHETANFLCTAIEQSYLSALEETKEKLEQYLTHNSECIVLTFSAGEPTKDGGYRQKFAGKWYQASPIDETPKCNCGLELTLSQLKEKIKGLKEK